MNAASQYSLASGKELDTAESSETGNAEARLGRDGVVGSRRVLHGNVISSQVPRLCPCRDGDKIGILNNHQGNVCRIAGS